MAIWLYMEKPDYGDEVGEILQLMRSIETENMMSNDA